MQDKITKVISVSKNINGIVICKSGSIIEFRKNGRKVLEMDEIKLRDMLLKVGLK